MARSSLRLDVKLPSAGFNGLVQEGDERIVGNVNERTTIASLQPDSRQTLYGSRHQPWGTTTTTRNHKISSRPISPRKKSPIVDSDILELNSPIPDVSPDRMKTMREQHQHFTTNKIMTPQSKLPTFLRPVNQRSSKANKLKKEKQQPNHQEVLKVVLDMSNEQVKIADATHAKTQTAMQTDTDKLKRQRQDIFDKFRSAPNSKSLPSFMLAAPPRSPSSPLSSGGPPIRITSLRATRSQSGRGHRGGRTDGSSVALQKAKIAHLVASANTSVQTFRKSPKRSSLERRAHARNRLHIRVQKSSRPSIPSKSGIDDFTFTGKV